MAEDWDLYAVVRSCKTPQTTSSTAATTTTTTNSAVTTDPMKVVKTTSLSSEDTLSCLASLTFEEENDPFCFPDLGEPRSKAFQELQEFYKPFFSNNPTTTTTTTSTTTSTHQGIIPNSSISDFGGSSGQHHVPQQQHHHHQQRLGPHRNDAVVNGPHRNDAVVNGPHQFTPQPYISGFDGVVVPRRVHHDQQDQNNQLLSPVATTTPTPPLPLPPLPLPTMSISPTTRSRKRKNQLKKMVCHVSAENLSSDLWAWRKYGQKPIKGSPYPRNYYRCSSSKGCAARKQVERSNTDPDTFIVTYTGDHTHPRPTHRNSLAGSTRNKLSPATTTTKREGSDQSPPPQQSTSSLSPTTQLAVAQAEEKDQVEKGDEKPIGEDILMEDEMDLENELDDEDDDDVLIPNMALSDDFFLGLKEMGCSPPGAAC